MPSLARICVFIDPENYTKSGMRPDRSTACEQAVEAAIKSVVCDDAVLFGVKSDPTGVVKIVVSSKGDEVFHATKLLNALQRLGIVVFRPEATGRWQIPKF